MTPPYHCGVVESAGRWMPLGLLYLAGSLRAAGHEVEVYDAMTKWHDLDDIRLHLKTREPDVVGISTITATAPASLEVLRAAKALDRPPVTVLGGVHGNFMFPEILDGAGSPVDYVVRGEGEKTFVELLSCLSAGGDTSKVEGIAFRRDGRVFATPACPFTPDLDTLLPAWDLVDWKEYTYFPFPGSRLAAVSTSRGCGFECSFCSQQKFWGNTWRGRSPEAVMAELELLRGEHGVDVVLFTDEFPTKDAARWRKMVELIRERDLGMRFLIETRVEDIVRDGARLEEFRRAGIVHVYVGVEATNQAALDRFNKNIRVEQSAEALRLINGADMISETSFVLGMPDETPDSIRRTLALAQEYAPDFAHFLLVAPWPYADIYRELEPYVETRDYGEYNLVSPVARSRAMSRKELRVASVECYRKFYMSKLPGWFALPDGFKKDYILKSMRLILKSSFLKSHMGGLGRIPAEVERYFSMLGVKS